jgi:hypothetical protein
MSRHPSFGAYRSGEAACRNAAVARSLTRDGEIPRNRLGRLRRAVVLGRLNLADGGSGLRRVGEMPMGNFGVSRRLFRFAGVERLRGRAMMLGR